MMPGAGSFYYHTCGPLSCPMGDGGFPITISYEGPLFSPSSPRPFIIRGRASLCSTTTYRV
jgi:hypothetical protein